MRADDEIVLARMDYDVVHRNGGDVVFELRPGLPAVGGIERAELGSDEEQVSVAWVLANHLRRTVGRKISADRCPVRAVVGAPQHVRLEIVVAVVVHRRVHSSRADFRSDDSADVGLVGNFRKSRISGPGGSPIARDGNHSIVGADVEQALSERRLIDGSDVAVIGSSLVTRDRITRPDLPHHRQAVAIELSGEIRSQSYPGVAAVGALEEIVRAEVERVVVVWRDEHRRAPVPPIRLRTKLG